MKERRPNSIGRAEPARPSLVGLTNRKLSIGPDLELPIDAVTQTFAFLAKRGVGKTYTAKVMAEEMLIAGLPVCIIDPVGVWWGLRSSADGNEAGLAVVVFGGEHADLPLESTSGETIAALIIEHRLQAICDLSLLKKGEQIRWMTAFCEKLYHSNRKALHLFVDEADAFAPQRPLPGEQRLLGAMEDIVRRGRARGLGVTLITQRAAVLNKNVLTQIEVLVCLRTIAPQDRAAIDAWINVHGTVEQRATLMESLPSLPIGHAWFWSPGWANLFQLVKVRALRTFDSSKTPNVIDMGGTPAGVAPVKMADVDLAALRQRLESTIQLADAKNPSKLRQRIAELEVELYNATCAAIDYDPRELESALQSVLESRRILQGVEDLVNQFLNRVRGQQQPAAGPPAKGMTNIKLVAPVSAIPDVKTSGQSRFSPKLPASSSDLTTMHRSMLTALAQHGALSKQQILLHTGYASSGPVSKAFAELGRRGWVSSDGRFLLITAAGEKALGSYDPLPSGAALRQWLLTGPKLSRMEQLLLQQIFDSYPHAIAKGKILERAGYASSGPVSRAFARLVRFGYVVTSGPSLLKAHPDLYEPQSGGARV